MSITLDDMLEVLYTAQTADGEPIDVSTIGVYVGGRLGDINYLESSPVSVDDLTDNQFCKTGKGGGVDPTCRPKRGGVGIDVIDKKKHGTFRAVVYDKKSKTYKYPDGKIPLAIKNAEKNGLYIPPPPDAYRPDPPKKTEFTGDKKKDSLISGWTNVYINDDPKAHMLAEGWDGKRWQQRYSNTKTAKKNARKFGSIQELRVKQDKLRKEMEKDSKNPLHKENADVMRVVNHTGLRIGGNQTEAEHKSYGISTLEGRHVIVKGGKVSLRFVPGKSKGKTKEFPVHDKAIAKMLVSRKKAAGDKGRLFDTTYSSVLNYSKTRKAGEFTPKEHRTLVATDLATEILKEYAGKKLDWKAYKRAVYDTATRVADTLGNTRNMAIDKYIDQTVWAAIRPKGAAMWPVNK